MFLGSLNYFYASINFLEAEKIFQKSETTNTNVDYRNLIDNLFNDKNLPETGLYDFIVNQIEKPLIESLLIKNSGSLSMTAKQLSIDESLLNEKISLLNIDEILIKK